MIRPHSSKRDVQMYGTLRDAGKIPHFGNVQPLVGNQLYLMKQTAIESLHKEESSEVDRKVNRLEIFGV